MVIVLPRELCLNEAIDFVGRLWESCLCEEYNIDFRNIDYFEPFTMIFVANEIKRFREKHSTARFNALMIEKSSISYAAHMGFFKAFGMEYGKNPGEASGSASYIPFTIINVNDLRREAADKYCDIQDLIEHKAIDIAKIVTREESGDLVDVLGFSIREVIRNVVEHSESDVIEYCVQYWPTKRLVEVAILDTGVGIMKALSSNPHISIANEKDAIQHAVLPGISGKMYKGVKKRPNDVWQNSGYGLYMISRICRNGGDFFIASNNTGVFLSGSGKSDKSFNYKGTALRLRIDTSKITSCKEMLGKYHDEGVAAAKQLSINSNICPSVASTMLARDFQK